ncbi:MAG: hypothetical protein RMN51_05450 [Verrucomicrobiota bacterium]|nr:hypothetical protein [Limisphaera sp.]MDW8381536.1 hypothetical protein [Verrucomicrobiota bacterium]
MARDVGPLYADFALTLQEGRRIEALGPLFSWEQNAEGVAWAIHPLVSIQRSTNVHNVSVDVLYPLSTLHGSGTEWRWQGLQLLSWSQGMDQEHRMTERWTLFPIWFWQRSENPERRAWALLPFYGHVEGRLFRDEIDVVLFPLWSRTRKRDVVTENWLYPLFHVRHGEGLSGWQFFPFWGREQKVPTWRTNSWGEPSLVPGHRKQFLMWPLFVESHAGLGGEDEIHQCLMLPFYAETRSTRFQHRSWGWPLGVTVRTNVATGYREVGAPWPFWVYGVGPDQSVRRFWPLAGSVRTTNVHRCFLLWPLWQQRHTEQAGLERNDTRLGLFVYREVDERFIEGRRLQRALWPLWIQSEDERGRKRLQVLAPLEPLLLGNKAVERNYSPLWSVWRAESDPDTGRSSQSLLWNLWRCESTPDSQKVSLLFGMVRYESRASGRTYWRVLGVPWNCRAERKSSLGQMRCPRSSSGLGLDVEMLRSEG